MVVRHQFARAVGRRGEAGAAAGRALWIVAGLALVASAAFSIGEVRGARHTDPTNAPAAASSSPLAGLSISGLQNLESQVSQAAAIAQSAQNATGSGSSSDLSQLEQQFGISPSASTSDQAAQLQAEIDAINACLSGSPSAVPDTC